MLLYGDESLSFDPEWLFENEVEECRGRVGECSVFVEHEGREGYEHILIGRRLLWPSLVLLSGNDGPTVKR
jgi:hypothetical protein